MREAVRERDFVCIKTVYVERLSVSFANKLGGSVMVVDVFMSGCVCVCVRATVYSFGQSLFLYNEQGCQSSAFWQNSALFLEGGGEGFCFFENHFLLFLKKMQKKLPVSDTATIRRVQRALVDSRWRLGLLVCASSVSGQSTKAMLQVVEQRKTIPRLTHLLRKLP